MRKILKKYYTLVAKDSLYSNSIYLMLNTAMLAGIGFFFWVICARIYTTEQVGLATTLISMMTLLSSFSLLGLGDGLVRYLPKSKVIDKKINTSFTMVGLLSILISIIFIIFIRYFSPKLVFVRESILFSILFIVLTTISSLNDISEFIFISFRASKYILFKNIILGVFKLTLPFGLVFLGAFGIYTSMAFAPTVAFIVCLILLFYRFKYIFKPAIYKVALKKMIKFSLGNYIAVFIVGVPSMLMPLLITNIIGAESSAFFYMGMMISSLLYIIPLSTSQSLFAEGSHNSEELKLHLKKASKIISIIMIPAILIIAFLGKYILLAFGKDYSQEGFLLLRYLAISGIFYSVNTIGGTILKIKLKVGLIITLSTLTSIIILTASILLLKYNLLGVSGVGIAWIIGQGVTAIVYLFIIKRNVFNNTVTG